MLAPSSPSSRTQQKKPHSGGLGWTAIVPCRAGPENTQRATYPEDEGVNDEEGFKAGDDRFGLHFWSVRWSRCEDSGERRDVAAVRRCSHTASLEQRSAAQRSAAHQHTHRGCWQLKAWKALVKV